MTGRERERQEKEEDPTEVGSPIIQRPHTRLYLKVSINSKLPCWRPKLQRWVCGVGQELSKSYSNQYRQFLEGGIKEGKMILNVGQKREGSERTTPGRE